METYQKTNIEKAYNEVLTLINDFEANESFYLSPIYQEAEVRKEYIDKFWIALGWDVNHQFQKNPRLQEVKIEKSQKQNDGLGQKRADYAFYLAPNFNRIQFFVEAKKPSRTLKENKEDYFQTAKYGYNAGTGVSILTDFQELLIIDCRFTPDFDTILNNKLRYFLYTDFRNFDVFEELYWIFSKEAVEAGNLDNYIEEIPKTKGGGSYQLRLFGGEQSIDDKFLGYLDSIRLRIAQAFYNNNNSLDKFDLTEATQKTIDRIVFIRFLEDKMIETISILQLLANHQHPWKKFISECKRLDTKYNGIVFKQIFIDRDDFLGADEEIFKTICLELYHVNNPYNFYYIPIHILGQIYERFLGKIIEVENGVCSIVLKPEVRKAGGIFYTPKYIVDYIVKETIGKQIEGKTPKEISKMAFADISCGSGSFLIGIYDIILEYHKFYFNEYPTEAKKHGCKFDTESGKWVLSIQQKQQILLNSIYGVDIDLQATEVTQLSLFLKMLEDETNATANDLLVLYSEKILPDLSKNIKWGNSLVGFEIAYEIIEFDKEERRKINPFDYNQSFPKVFANGGFDAVIGNPPYVKEPTSKESFEWVKKGRLSRYYQVKMDLWYFFVCHGLDLIRPNGILGYITPNNWVSNAGASLMRKKIIEDSKILALIDFNALMVFKDASIQTMIMILKKDNKTDSYSFKNQIFTIKKAKEDYIEKELQNYSNVISKTIYPNIKRIDFKDKFLKFDNKDDGAILNKIQKASNFILDAKKEVAQGIVPNPDVLSKKAYEKHYLNVQGYRPKAPVFVVPRNYFKELNSTEKSILKPLFEPSELSKYFIPRQSKLEIIYLTKSTEKDNIKNLINHLKKFELVMNERRETKNGRLKYYHLHWPREESFFSRGDKIISVRKCEAPTFVYTQDEAYFMMSCNIIKSKRINLKYLTGILNSELIKFWLIKKGKMQGNQFQIDKEPILNIPIIKTKNKETEINLIALVENAIKLKKQEKDEQNDHEKNFLMTLYNRNEKEINNLVYEIYEISIEEQNIIGAFFAEMEK
jgi:adenine-specific DNA-methyltransferase